MSRHDAVLEHIQRINHDGMCINCVQIGVARRAADRLSEKLEEARGQGAAVDMEEEFRLLTLQVIGEAVLSLPPEECDRVRRKLSSLFAQDDVHSA